MTEKRLAIVLPVLAVVLVSLNLFCTPIGALRLAMLRGGFIGEATTLNVEQVAAAKPNAGHVLHLEITSDEAPQRWDVLRHGIFYRAQAVE